jgi:hypothetical protein
MTSKEKQIIYWEDMLRVYEDGIAGIIGNIGLHYNVEVGIYPKYKTASDGYIDDIMRVQQVRELIKELKQ